MKFYSTNNKDLRASFKEALLTGLPKDNGLFMPEYIPNLSNLVKGIKDLDFKDIAYVISKSFLVDDFNNSDIEDIIENSITFDAPVENITSNINLFMCDTNSIFIRF